MPMQDKEKIIINDHIQGDPLSEENLNKTLEYVNKFRLLIPEKTIWLYTGYNVNFFEIPYSDHTEIEVIPRDENNENNLKRINIIKRCSVIVDGRYIDSQRNISKKWAGSDNQRCIDVQKSLQQGKVVLFCD